MNMLQEVINSGKLNDLIVYKEIIAYKLLFSIFFINLSGIMFSLVAVLLLSLIILLLLLFLLETFIVEV